MKTNFKLAVSDIDETLAPIGDPISPENLKAIQKLQENGIEFVLASGRHHENMEPFCKSVPGINWVISAQGGMVANRDRSEILYSSYLEATKVERYVSVGENAGYSILVYTKDGVFSPHEGKWIDFYENIATNIVTKESLAQVLKREAFKVVWIGEEELISNAKHVLPDEKEVIQFQTHPHLYEFMPAATSKGQAVAVLAKHLGIGLDQILTMGDGNNDVSMLEISGCSIAMGHGSEAAIEAGKIVTPSNIANTALAHGVEVFFEDYFKA